MYKAKQMIVMRKDLKMRKGKIAAQAGHASTEAILQALASQDRLKDIRLNGSHVELKKRLGKHSALSDWFGHGVAKICVYVNSEEELLEIDRKAKEAGLISALVLDGGLTEFHGEPTYTCLAIEPAYPDQVDPITGDLPLY